MSFFLRDVRFAVRSALRQPGLTLVIVFTLAIGIGANTGIYTLLHELYWAGVDAPEPDRLFRIRTGTAEEPEGSGSYLDGLAYREALADVGDVSFQSFYGAVLGLPGQGDAEGETTYRIGAAVSPEYFDFFGLRFAQGRPFAPGDDDPAAPPVAVVNYTFWSRYLGADPTVLGKTIRVNRVPFTLVGVTPRGFQGTGIPFAVYIPIRQADKIVPRPFLDRRDNQRVFSHLRLAPGVSPETVEARLAVLARSLDQEHPWPQGRKRHLTLRGISDFDAGPDTGQMAMVVAVGLLLLLASANVANLLLARAAGRRREIAVLAAIGATRWRIAMRLLIESLLLSFLGGALGIAFSRWLTEYIKGYVAVLPIGLASWAEGGEYLRLDARVLFFTLAVSVLTGSVFGLAPVLHAARTDLVSALKAHALEAKPGRRFGARQALVVTQVLLSTVLLLGAALLARSLGDLEGRDPGFEIEHQLVAALSTAPPRTETPEQLREAQRRLYAIARERVAELPGVASVTLVSDPFGNGFAREASLLLPEMGDEPATVDRVTVGPGFFDTYRIALLRGRGFDERERAGGAGSAVVNQAFVDRYWPGQDSLGRELRLPDLGADVAEDRFTVVGVATDVRHASRRDAPAPLVYVPLAQHLAASRQYLVARTEGPPGAMTDEVRKALSTAHPDLAMIELDTYERLIAVDLTFERMWSGIAGLFSVFGLGLACLGIYSVMSFSVSYRLRELGIRMAVGATARDLVRLVLREAFVLVALGVLVGVGASLGLSRFLASVLHGITPHDPRTYLTVPLALVAVAVAAAWLPAWRAGQVDPKTALLEE